MKKYLKILIVLLTIILIPNVLADVSGAKLVPSADVEANTYVIGRHMFTRQTNDDYNGQLTTQLIMLAAKTIDGNSLDDMVIYYKTARGTWINGLTGQTINVPVIFDIDVQDTVNVPYPSEIEVLGEGADSESFGYQFGIYRQAKGEVFCSFDDGEYELYGDYDFSEFVRAASDPITGAHIGDVYEPEGHLGIEKEGYGSIECKIRTYVENGSERIYSEFSEERRIENYLNPTVLTIAGAYGSVDPDTQEVINHIDFQLKQYFDLFDYLGSVPNDGGVMLYASSTKNGEYTLVETFLGEVVNSVGNPDLIFGLDNYPEDYVYFKAKIFRVINDHTYYSYYSNIVSIDSMKPQLFLENGLGSTDKKTVTSTYAIYGNDHYGEYTLKQNEYYQVARRLSSVGNDQTFEDITNDVVFNYLPNQAVSFTNEANVPYGETVYYKIRVCESDAINKICGPWSDTVSFTNDPPAPVLTNMTIAGWEDPNHAEFMPVLINGVYSYDLSINTDYYAIIIGNYPDAYQIESDIAGYDIYEKNGNEYTLVGEGFPHEPETMEVNVAPGEVKTYVARVYVMIKGAPVYSDYSEELVIDHSTYDAPVLLNQTIELWNAEHETPFEPTLNEGVYKYDLGINTDYYSFVVGNLLGDHQIPASITGYEIYEKVGNSYTLVGEGTPHDPEVIEVSVAPGESKTFVARVYAEKANHDKVYSDYSEELVIDHTN